MPDYRDSPIEMAVLVHRVRHDANNPFTAALGPIQVVLESPDMPEDEVPASLRIAWTELIRLAEIPRWLKEVKPPVVEGGDHPPGA